MDSIFPHILKRSLAHVTRFSGTPQHFHESVAEHSFYTAYIAMLLCRLLEEAGEDVDTERVVSMALVHDMEEMFSGDILTPFKHHSPEVTEAIRKVNREVIHTVFSNLPDGLREQNIALWSEDAQGETVEAQIVKTADRLSLIAKCAEEVRVGNSFFQDIYDTQLQLLYDSEAPWWKKIKERVLPPQ